MQWAAGTSAEAAETEEVAASEVAVSTSAAPETTTELPRADTLKQETKSKPELKSDKSKTDSKSDKSKSDSKSELKSKETKVEKTKTEYKTDSGGEGSATPPSRRRASADAHSTPDRKKRRLTRPRKL